MTGEGYSCRYKGPADISLGMDCPQKITNLQRFGVSRAFKLSGEKPSRENKTIRLEECGPKEEYENLLVC